MSDPDSTIQEERERSFNKEKKKEKKRRKAERRISEGLASDNLKLAISSDTLQDTDVFSRRKREKKEAKKLKKHKEASAAGQKLTSDVGSPAKEMQEAGTSPSRMSDGAASKVKKDSKRKERPQEAQQSELASGSSQKVSDAIVETDGAPSLLSLSGKGNDPQKPKKKKARLDAVSIGTKEVAPASESSNTRSNEADSPAKAPSAEEEAEKTKKREEKRERKRLKEGKKGKEKEKSDEVTPVLGMETTAVGKALEKRAPQARNSTTSEASSGPSQVTAPEPNSLNVQGQIDRLFPKGRTGNAGRSNRGSGSATRQRSTSPSSPHSGVLATSTKEGLLEDARLLSHKEMLVDRLYHTYQLKWLQEELGLKIKSGRFSQWEKDQIDRTIDAFQKEHKLSDEDFITWLFADKQDKDDKDLYADFWKGVTASLEDRPNRAVRIYVRRSLQPDAMQGAWSEAESTKLEKAVQANGQNWSAVSKAVGARSPEDCRLRWRDFGTDVIAARKKGHFTVEDKDELAAAVRSVCEKAEVDPMSPNSKIPWKLVSRQINGKRTPPHCLIKWQAMLTEMRSGEGPFKWTLNDSKVLISRLARQKKALERDDFTERWKGLVAEYVSPTIDYKTNFRYNVQTIAKALSSLNDDSVSRKRRRSQAKEDLIDSDEEA